MDPATLRMRHVILTVTLVLAVGALATSCRSGIDGSGSPTTGRNGPSTFDDVDAAMTARMREDSIDVGALLVATSDGTVLHQQLFGEAVGGEVMSIASASKWLTAATLMSLVDEGRLSLDEPVVRWLPGFGEGDKARITLRQLMSHTSGITSDDCLWDRTTTMAACVDEIATNPLVNPPGQAFHYGNTSFQVAARLGEVVSGQPFQDLFFERIARPLGMTDTRFDSGQPTDNPVPAASGSSTAGDYGRFLRMLVNRGTLDGHRILSPGSVEEIERDQVAGLDTSRDQAVQITGVPTYGLGLWRDQVDAADQAVVVSGSGSLGFYPWIDHVHGTYGIVAVADETHSDGRAVRASQRTARLAIDATATALSATASTTTTR